MRNIRRKLTLDRAAVYEIKVPGELGESWSDWAGGMAIAVESEGEGPPIRLPCRACCAGSIPWACP